MKYPFRILVIVFLFIFAGNVRADGAAMQKEIDQLKQRLEELEKKKEAPESEASGTSEEMAKKITFSGVIAGAYQYESVSGPSVADDFGRGALPIQAEVSIKPTETDEMFFKFGFAAGNGLNTEKHLFALAPWAADLEDDVKDSMVAAGIICLRHGTSICLPLTKGTRWALPAVSSTPRIISMKTGMPMMKRSRVPEPYVVVPFK